MKFSNRAFQLCALAGFLGSCAALGGAPKQAQIVSFAEGAPETVLPGAADALLAKAQANLAAGESATAISLFRQYLRSAPHSVDAYNGMAIAYDRIGRFDLSRRYYEVALKLSPEDSRVINNIGYSLAIQGERNAAKPFFDRASQLSKRENEKIVIAENIEKQSTMTQVVVERGKTTGQGQTNIERIDATTQLLALAAKPAKIVSFAEAAPKPSPPAVRIDIFNGVGVLGLAKATSTSLQRKHFQTGRIANIAGFQERISSLSYPRQQSMLATQLVNALPFPVRMKVVGNNTQNLKLIIGANYRQPSASINLLLPANANLKSGV
jgi:tetratricopeptide (TPR) repeat protein